MMLVVVVWLSVFCCCLSTPAKAQLIAVGSPVEQADYANALGGNLQSPVGVPLCGVESFHSNIQEDRRFKFSTCAIQDGAYAAAVGSQTTFETYWDVEFTLHCELDKVLTGLSSYHSNHAEDRRWTATCTHFQDTVVNLTSCDNGLTGSYVNVVDGPFDFTCPAGKVITAINSIHSNAQEDRRFRFECCALEVDTLAQGTGSLVVDPFSGYLNSYDLPLAVSSPGGFCGIESVHSITTKDRIFQFQYCTPSTGTQSAVEYITTTPNALDAISTVTCPGNSVLSYINSTHDSGKEDRIWYYECRSFSGWSTDLCQWTDYANFWNQQLLYQTGDKHVIAGLSSFHDNTPEDRRFQFYTCRWIPDAPPTLPGAKGDPYITDWSGRIYDYMASCDLVLLSHPTFRHVGLEVHVRTTIRMNYSYISTMAVRLGQDILEVYSHGVAFLNGVQLVNDSLNETSSVFPLMYRSPRKGVHEYLIDISPQRRGRRQIIVRTIASFGGVRFKHATQADFGKSVGLLGQFGTGLHLARDGTTVLEDENEFGQEWQVRSDEQQLFMDKLRFPQHPNRCILPEHPLVVHRRLGELSGLQAQAEKACAHAVDQERSICITDVVRTGSVEIAGFYYREDED